MLKWRESWESQRGLGYFPQDMAVFGNHFHGAKILQFKTTVEFFPVARSLFI